MNILIPNWPKPSNIQAICTLKNCLINNNITDFIYKYINNNDISLFLLDQEHGNTVLSANKNNKIPKADGSFTQQKNLICAVKTADCLPILITNPAGTFVASLHAGWRSLASGIIQNFFKQIKLFDFKNSELLFWFGPAISKQAFEIGEDVLEQFKITNIDLYKNICHKAIIKINKINNKYLADIYKIAELALAQFDITHNQIFSDNYCTYLQQELFYSHRREPENKNRMFSLIWIDSTFNYFT